MSCDHLECACGPCVYGTIAEPPPVASTRTMPAQRPGISKQDYCTPRVFLNAVEARFGRIGVDLAATKTQRVTECYFGPDHDLASCHNSLHCRWRLSYAGLLWLNPPYSRVAPWASKCAVEASHGAQIALLVPASVGAAWYWQHVAPFAHVMSVGRLTFVTRNADGTETPACFSAKGKPTPYPKDLILAIYGQRSDARGQPLTPGTFERWEWR